MARTVTRIAQALALALVILAGVAATTPTVWADCGGSATGNCKDAGARPHPSPFDSLLVWLVSFLG